jgi:hypothetical protein
MQMKRTLQLAKDRAQSGFALLAKRMVADADASLLEALTAARSAMDQSAMHAARKFLRNDGDRLVSYLDVFYRNYLDRAMQTMYTNLRPELQNFTSMELSLIDDETMNRQIEVDRLLLRMRDADPENLGKINLMIAQLHGEHEIKERENPFRPYLLARSLHEVLKEMVEDETVVKVLFQYLSDSMMKQLPTFYISIRDAFESTGVQATLSARPSMLSKGQRDLLAQKAWRSNFNASLASLGSAAPGYLGAPPEEDNSNNAEFGFQDLVRQIFNLPQWAGKARSVQSVQSTGGMQLPPQLQQLQQSQGGVPQSQGTQQAPQQQPVQQAQYQSQANDNANRQTLAPASEGMLSKLKQYQQMAAAGKPVNDQITVGQNQLFAVREEIHTEEATSQEFITIELIALLFSFILMDEQISVVLREKIGRLQIPFLKAAMIEPEVLHNTTHPARQLLNRMGSIAVKLDPDAPTTNQIEKEITRIVEKILSKFDRDTAIFKECLGELEQFIVHELHYDEPVDGEGERVNRDIIEDAEKICVILAIVAKAFDNVLESLIVDGRIVDFIMQTWTRVVAWSIYKEMGSSNSVRTAGPATMPYLEILPELVWSAQLRPTNQERSVLMRFLPGLVVRLKNGLKSIRLGDEKYQHALDQLVSVHTEVLGASQMMETVAPVSLEDLQTHFATLDMNSRLTAMTEAGRITIQADVIESVLAERKAVAKLFLVPEEISDLQSDVDWLAQLQLGICITYQADGADNIARLIHISSQRMLYLFKPDDNSDPMVFSSGALSKAVREGVIGLFESAPLFERAVDAIMTDAEST